MRSEGTPDRDVRAPSFAEPWEATVHALVHVLLERGFITKAEWANTLGAAIKQAQGGGDPDDGTRYYAHVLNALETLVDGKNIANSELLVSRKEAWRHAYVTTPHGKPVVLPESEQEADAG